MSVKKFKVGDKVRVRSGLVIGTDYGGVFVNEYTASLAGEVLTIRRLGWGWYRVSENGWQWSDEMLESVEKTLDDLCAGDDISRGSGVRKVLAAVDGCYLLSNTDEYTVANDWYTADELKQIGYQVLPPGHSITLIEIDGKRYDEAEVKKAIKDLEPIE